MDKQDLWTTSLVLAFHLLPLFLKLSVAQLEFYAKSIRCRVDSN